jgi:hypothetical protein
MRGVTAEDIEAELAFARKAAANFAQHPEHATFGNIEPGGLFAVRWGLGNDCVLVLKLDETHTPTNYQQLVKEIPC